MSPCVHGSERARLVAELRARAERYEIGAAEQDDGPAGQFSGIAFGLRLAARIVEEGGDDDG